MDRVDRFLLLQRIEAHGLDEPGAADPFSARLARENGWSPHYTARVITEYMRFVFLAATAGHTVSPSDQVDQAWHLHMTYSRSYWSIFCEDVLGRTLHHGPSPGGAAATMKCRHDYERTLESYRGAFAAEPPADIWSPVEQRFGTDLCNQRVNTALNWVIPKPRWWTLVTSPGVSRGPRWARRIAMALTAGLVASLCEVTDIYQLHGADFLFPYLVAWILTLGFAGLWDGLGAGPSSRPTPILNLYQTAYLAGGPRRALGTALATLLAQKHVTLCPGDATVVRRAPLPGDAHSLEADIHARITEQPVAVTDALKGADATLDGIEKELSAVGLWRTTAPLLPLLLGVGLTTVGALKIIVGLSNGRPVGFLFLIGLGGALGLGAVFAARRRATPRGQELVAAMEAKQASLRSADARLFEQQPEHLGLAVALFGTGALSVTPWSALTPALTSLELTSERNSAGGDGGCGGGGCGGGCGGCGGCGG